MAPTTSAPALRQFSAGLGGTNGGKAELLGKMIAEGGRADFRKSPVRSWRHQRGAEKSAIFRVHRKCRRLRGSYAGFSICLTGHRAPTSRRRRRSIAQHVDDVLRDSSQNSCPCSRSWESAAFSIIAMKIPLREAGQRRAAEMRVLRQVIVGAHRAIGEIAAATAGNAGSVPNLRRCDQSAASLPPGAGLGLRTSCRQRRRR